MIYEPKMIIGNPELDKWAYNDSVEKPLAGSFIDTESSNMVLFDTSLSKIMLFVQPNELLLCASGDTIISILEKIRKK